MALPAMNAMKTPTANTSAIAHLLIDRTNR